MSKVFIMNGWHQYTELFKQLGFDITDNYVEADLIVFTGGEDVSPFLYGDKQHTATYASEERDEEEAKLFSVCQLLGKKMVGICRGGQFLNVMSGGRMYQDVTKHLGDHPMIDLETGRTILVSSTHHQMMMPSGNAIIVAISTLGGNREWYDGQVLKRDTSNTDYEVLYYPHTGCLCFQPHPEFTGEQYQDMKDIFLDYLKKYLGIIP